MPVNASFDEPAIPARVQRPLAAVWISLGLHAAVIALVQVAPLAARLGEPVIEARLVSTHAAAPEVETPDEPLKAVPLLAPSETAEALPAEPVPPAAADDAEPPPASAREAQGAAQPAPAVAVTSAVDLTYYNVRDLDVQPRALREIVPDYPDEADRQRLSGKVRLKLKLEADGRVSDVDVVSSTPPGLFDDAAARAFRDAHFAPAQKNGRPVRALVLIEVEFD